MDKCEQKGDVKRQNKNIDNEKELIAKKARNSIYFKADIINDRATIMSDDEKL